MIKYIRSIFLLAILTLSIHSLAQVTKSPIPKWVKPFEIDQINNENQNSSGGLDYIILDKHEHVVNQSIFNHHAYKVTTASGVQENSQISVSYDPSYEKIYFHKLLIHRNGKTIDKLDLNKVNEIQRETELEKHLYDESLTAYINLEDVRIGDIIEYQYSRIGKNPIYKGKFFTTVNFNYTLPIRKLRYLLIAPKENDYDFKFFNGEIKSQTVSRGNETTYEWSTNNVEAVDLDDYLPEWYDPFTYLDISEFKNWEELEDWAQGLFVINEHATANIDHYVKQITATHADKNNQANAIINFVQSEVRYLGLEGGISAYKPHAPNQVFEQRYGDCKDKSLLLVKMLEKINIESYPVLINTVQRQEISKTLPSPGKFNHCIVLIKKDGEDIWIDPTINEQGGTLYGHYFPNYKKALVVDNKLDGLNDVPDNSDANISVVENFTIDDFESSVFFKIETKYSGYEADYQRRYLKNQNINEVNKDYLNYYANQYPDIKIYDTLSIQDDKINNTITINESYDIFDFWNKVAGSDQALSAVFSPTLLASYFLEPSTQIRSMPLGVNHPVKVNFKTIVKLPEVWTIKEETNTIKSPSFVLDIATTYSNKVFTMNYTYETLKGSVPPEEMSEYLKALKDVDNNIGYSISYDKSQMDSIGSGISYFMLILGIISASIGTYYALKVNQNYNPPSLDYKVAYDNIGGWLVLPAIGLCLNPFIQLYSLYTNEYLTSATFDITFNTLFTAYNPLLGTTVIIEFIGQILLLCLTVLVISQFFNRRSSVPRLIQFLYASNMIYLIIMAVLISSIDIMDPATVSESFKSLFRSVVAAAIWIPYFSKSERVNETFVVRINTNDKGTVPEEVIN